MGSSRFIIVCALLGAAIAGGISPHALSDPTSSDTSSAVPSPATIIDHDGIYQVGTDILPGIYRSEGGVDNVACYWKRIHDDQIVENGLSKHPQIVQIDPDDTSFKTHYCQPWHLTECPPDCPPPTKANLGDFLKGFFPQPDRSLPESEDK